MNLYRQILPAAVALALMGGIQNVSAEHLVLLHTNDTHSQIYPDADGLGGIQRRKAVVDSVRAVRRNVMLIDAGDIVQGTLFFNIGGGQVEEKLMNALGYDLRILGNHEFDNGADSLAGNLAGAKAELLSTNYRLDGSPLDGLFKKYAVRTYGGKRIGFMGINLRPEGMIAEGNYDGVGYLDAVAAANSTARYLRDVEGVDAVVAVTHVGYSPSEPPGDLDIAAASKDIDIIIGGHSHTLVDPASGHMHRVKNADGREILVAQAGKRGHYVGQIDIDLDSLSALPEYTLIRIDGRLDGKADPEIDAIIEPYRRGVDSLMTLKVGESAIALDRDGRPLLNFVADYMVTRGRQLAGDVDLGLINKGGLRTSLPKGDITEGMVINMMPFNNYTTVIDLKGSDLMDALDVMARTGGNGVSRNVAVEYSPVSKKCTSVRIDGKPLDKDKVYRVATIDYLANGGDYMQSLSNGKVVARSPQVLYRDLLTHFRTDLKGKKIKPSGENRFKAK